MVSCMGCVEVELKMEVLERQVFAGCYNAVKSKLNQIAWRNQSEMVETLCLKNDKL